ncbi:hypothetical protein [Bacillus sp. 1P06AnD]|uniref:hypothetical protein n=1 Tax=Bacillus sp. 1P06AnD TaxID=3132208 RepID=UPI0039A3F006
MKNRGKVSLMMGIFRTESNSAELVIGEGFTLVEAVLRAIEINEDDNEIHEMVQIYGPDDFAGLYEWYVDSVNVNINMYTFAWIRMYRITRSLLLNDPLIGMNHLS